MGTFLNIEHWWKIEGLPKKVFAKMVDVLARHGFKEETRLAEANDKLVLIYSQHKGENDACESAISRYLATHIDLKPEDFRKGSEEIIAGFDRSNLVFDNFEELRFAHPGIPLMRLLVDPNRAIDSGGELPDVFGVSWIIDDTLFLNSEWHLDETRLDPIESVARDAFESCQAWMTIMALEGNGDVRPAWRALAEGRLPTSRETIWFISRRALDDCRVRGSALPRGSRELPGGGLALRNLSTPPPRR